MYFILLLLTICKYLEYKCDCTFLNVVAILFLFLTSLWAAILDRNGVRLGVVPRYHFYFYKGFVLFKKKKNTSNTYLPGPDCLVLPGPIEMLLGQPLDTAVTSLSQ